jgi:hypothetical protein
VQNGKEATVEASKIAWLQPLLWVIAIVLFVIGGYSDTNTTECWAWAFALLTAGVQVTSLPGSSPARELSGPTYAGR